MTDMKYEFIRSGPIIEPCGTPYISSRLSCCSILPILFYHSNVAALANYTLWGKQNCCSFIFST